MQIPRLKMRNHWSQWHLIVGGPLLALGIAAQWPAWVDIAQIALHDEEASHILLVPIVAIWLFWVRRGRLRGAAPRGTWSGPLLILVGWTLSWFGFYHAVQAAWHLGAILVAVGCVLAVAGTDILLRFLPVFLVLLFLVPVPGLIRQQLSIPLQTATAAATQEVLSALGTPVERYGNLLRINGVPVAIAEACNGMRMVFTLVLVSYGFAFGTPLRLYVRIIILAAAPLTAIAANVIRLIPTVWIYGQASDHFAARFHDISGWLMVPIAFLALLSIIRLLRWALLPVSPFTLAYE
jgi:exosortase